LLSAAARSPTLAIGVPLIGLFLIAALAQRLASVDAPGLLAALGALLLTVLTFRSQAARGRGDADGVFGFVIADPRLRLRVVLERTAIRVGLVWSGAAALVAAVRPDGLGTWTLVSLAGVALGVGLGIAGAGFSLRSRPLQPSTARPTRDRARFAAGAILGTLMVLGVHRLSQQDATIPARTLAVTTLLLTVGPTLRFDPKRLNLLAAAPVSTTRLIHPSVWPPALVAVCVAGLLAQAMDLPLGPSIGLALSCGVAAGVVAIMLALSTIGRSDAGARLAAGVELALLVGAMSAGLAFVGPASLLWAPLRLVWLWRRAARTRWRDPGETG